MTGLLFVIVPKQAIIIKGTKGSVIRENEFLFR